MADVYTRLSDVIVPEHWAGYAQRMTAEKSALMRSGIAEGSKELDGMISAGGRFINLPMWSDLGGEDMVLPAAGNIEVGSITAGNELAPVLVRAKAWGAHELAGAMAGDDPMAAILDRYTDWWVRREQKILLSILAGLFDKTSGVLRGNVSDISANTGDAAKISAAAVLDAKQILGDGAAAITAIAMHSATYTKLQKDNLVEYIPNSEGVVDMPRYLGYQVIVDDGLPVSSGKYTTYLVGKGAFARGEGVPPTLTPVEIARNAAASENVLFTRRALVIHPRGIKWVEPSAYTNEDDPTPANADLSTPGNWSLIAGARQIPLVALIHGI